jgi:hypothetical protein
MFAGRCAVCSLRIEAGEDIEFRPDAPKGKRAVHAACADTQQKQQDAPQVPQAPAGQMPQFDIHTPQHAPQIEQPKPGRRLIHVYRDNFGSWCYAPANCVTAIWRGIEPESILSLFDVLAMVAGDTCLPADYKLLFDPEAEAEMPGITANTADAPIDDDIPW